MIKRRVEKLEGEHRPPSSIASQRESADIAMHTLHQRHAGMSADACRCSKCYTPPARLPLGATPDEIIENIKARHIDLSCIKIERSAVLDNAKPCTCETCTRRKADGLPRLIITDYDKAVTH